MAATTYTIDADPTGTVGVAQLVSVLLDDADTVTITLASDDGTFDEAEIAFDAEDGPLTALFTPTAAGTVTISGTNDGALEDPEDAEIEVEAAPVVVATPESPPGGTSKRSLKQRVLAKLSREIGRAAALRYVRLLTVGPEVEDEAEMMSTTKPRAPGRI
jgi:hypothetical protein